jgi:hypothetical protein
MPIRSPRAVHGAQAAPLPGMTDAASAAAFQLPEHLQEAARTQLGETPEGLLAALSQLRTRIASAQQACSPGGRGQGTRLQLLRQWLLGLRSPACAIQGGGPGMNCPEPQTALKMGVGPPNTIRPQAPSRQQLWQALLLHMPPPPRPSHPPCRRPACSSCGRRGCWMTATWWQPCARASCGWRLHWRPLPTGKPAGGRVSGRRRLGAGAVGGPGARRRRTWLAGPWLQADHCGPAAAWLQGAVLPCLPRPGHRAQGARRALLPIVGPPQSLQPTRPQHAPCARSHLT